MAAETPSGRLPCRLLLGSFARWLLFSLLVLEVQAWGNLSATQAWNIISFNLDLPPGLESATLSNLLQQAAATLDQSAPDIIVVREVPDWATGASLARSLTSGTFRVVVCSSFRAGADRGGATRQIAMLSKHPAYLAWAEGWQHNWGGYAFAAFRSPLGKLGLFALTIDAPANPLVFESEWEDAVAGFRTWQSNRLDAAVVLAATPSEKLRNSPDFGRALIAPFPSPFLTNPPLASAFAVELPNVPERLPAFITTVSPSSFTVTLGAPSLAARMSQPSQHVASAPVDRQGRGGTAVEPKSQHRLRVRSQTWIGLGAGSALLIGFMLLRRRRGTVSLVRRSRPALARENQQAYNNRSRPTALPPDQAEAVLGKLVADRTILLENQQVSAKAVNAAEELVAKVEQQLRQQAGAYDDRVEELTRELAAADEESRLLIQSRIQQIKSQIIEKGSVRPE